MHQKYMYSVSKSCFLISRKRHCFGLISGFPLPLHQGRGTVLGIVVLLLFSNSYFIYIYIYIPIYDLKCQTVIMIVVIRKEYNMDQIIGFHFSQPKESVSHFYGRS